MSDRDRLRVMLELDVGAEPIVGSLQAHGRRLDFSGWVGLATALEQVITSAGGSPGGSAPTAEQSASPGRLTR